MTPRPEYAVLDRDDRLVVFPSAPSGMFKTRRAAAAAAATYPGARVAEVVEMSTLFDGLPVLTAGVPPWERLPVKE